MAEMEEKIRILLLEDLYTDAELALREIQKAGIVFDHRQVDNEADYCRELDEFDPDIIVSDYSMPGFDGMSALNIALSRDSYIPFIILTGSMNEEVAVACMKAGATDYVIKENIKRLPFAVIEAIDNKHIRMQKESLRKQLVESEKKYRTIFEQIQDVYYETDFAGTILEISPSIKSLSNGRYQRDELIGKHINDFYTDPEQREVLLEELTRSGSVTDFEISLRNRDGSVLICSISSRLVSDSENRPEKIVGVMRNITERKKAEDEILRLKDGLEEQVKKKTGELKEKINEMQRFIDATVDRELRMEEMYREMEELRRKLKQKGK